MQFLWDNYKKILQGKWERKQMSISAEENKKRILAAIESRKQTVLPPVVMPLLITIKNGVVDEAVVARDSGHLEELFKQANRDHGRETNDDEMMDGYVELEDVTICMTWACLPEVCRPANSSQIELKEDHFYRIEFHLASAPAHTHYSGIAKMLHWEKGRTNSACFMLENGGVGIFYPVDVVAEITDMTEAEWQTRLKAG